MAQLAIKGHTTRGEEVIKILKKDIPIGTLKNIEKQAGVKFP